MVLFALSTTFAYAFGPGHFGKDRVREGDRHQGKVAHQGMTPHFGMAPHPGMGMTDFHGMMDGCMMRVGHVLHQLELTSEQQAAFEEIKTQALIDGITQGSEMVISGIKLHAEMKKDKPDEKKVNQYIEDFTAKQSVLMKNLSASISQAKAKLDPAQLIKLNKIMKEMRHPRPPRHIMASRRGRSDDGHLSKVHKGKGRHGDFKSHGKRGKKSFDPKSKIFGFIKKLKGLNKYLELTDEQQTKVDGIKTDAMIKGVTNGASMAISGIKIRSQLKNDKVDQKEVNSLIDSFTASQAEIMKAVTKAVINVKAQLTPSQLKKLKEFKGHIKKNKSRIKKNKGHIKKNKDPKKGKAKMKKKAFREQGKGKEHRQMPSADIKK